MKKMRLGDTPQEVPVIVSGCMRMEALAIKDAALFIDAAVETGINFFDHADIYGAGKSEEIFSEALKETGIAREELILQSKCGIRKGYYDFSKEYIIDSVDGILKRLHTEYLDILLLHRPDILAEPEEVAEAFDILEKNGKVKYFGVSNEKPMQIELLQKYVKQKLIINQLQFSIMSASMVTNGVNVNMENEQAVDRDGSVLDYCRLHDITIQPWSPFQYGFFEGVYLDNDKFPELNKKIDELAGNYKITNSALVIAWILRHPAHMQPIVGTMNPDRIRAIAKAADVMMTKQEWYEIYKAAGNVLP